MAGCHVIELSLCAVFMVKDISVFQRLEFRTVAEMRRIEVGIFSSRYDDVGGGIDAAKQKLLGEARKRKNLNWIWNNLP